MTLHLLNKSPQHMAVVTRMLAATSPGDRILLIEDAVYHALPRTEALIAELSAVEIYALKADLCARGIDDKARAEIHIVDDKGFVRLSCEADKVVSW